MEKITRIKYTTDDTGVLVSKKGFLSVTGELLLVGIDPGAKIVTVVKVLDNDDTVPLGTREFTTLSDGKKVAKAMLKEFGVSFFEEVRKKKEVV